MARRTFQGPRGDWLPAREFNRQWKIVFNALKARGMQVQGFDAQNVSLYITADKLRCYQVAHIPTWLLAVFMPELIESNVLPDPVQRAKDTVKAKREEVMLQGKYMRKWQQALSQTKEWQKAPNPTTGKKKPKALTLDMSTGANKKITIDVSVGTRKKRVIEGTSYNYITN